MVIGSSSSSYSSMTGLKDDIRVFMGRFVDDCYRFVYFVLGQLEYDHGNVTGAHGGRPLRDPGWSK